MKQDLGPITLVVPEDHALISGGNVYNRALSAALAPLHPMRVVLASAWAPDEPGVHLVDSLCLAELRVALDRPGAGQLVLLAHHLPSLEPGLAPGDPARLLEEAVLSRVAGVLTTSAYLRQQLIARGLAPSRVLSVPPAPPQKLVPARKAPEAFHVLIVGNLIPRKGIHELLMELAQQLREEPLTLEIVGRTDLDPVYAERCARLIAELAALCARASIMGPVAPEAMHAHYRRASVLVSAAHMETFGMAMQEARHYGVPVLALDAGNAREHVAEGVNGHLFASVSALAAGIVELARDRERSLRLVAGADALRARTLVSWDEAARSLLEQLRQLVQP